MEARCTNSVYYRNDNSEKLNTDGYINRGNGYQNVPSLDQMTSLMVGFSLIHKLVDDIYVKPTSSDAGFNVVTETKLIVDRMMTYASTRNWFIIDINGWPVANGGGDLCFAAYPLTQAANRILGSTSYHSHFKREDINYGGIQHCITGFGSDDQITQIEACDNLNLLQSNKKSYLQNLNAGIPGTQNNQYNSVFQSWQLGGSLNIPISASSSVWNSLIVSISDPEFFTLFNRDKYMKEYHRTIIFNLGVVSGQWDKNQAKSWSLFTGNKQLELINAILTNTTPVNGFFDFRTLLDVMPIEGSYNLKGGNWPQPHTDSKFQTNGWGGEYRWTNPDASMGVGREHGIYKAIDYMLFHNLYRLVFHPNLAYAPTSDCYCGNPISKLVFQSTDGKIVLATTYNETENALKTINVSSWNPRIYLYKYTIANGKTFMGKLVVK